MHISSISLLRPPAPPLPPQRKMAWCDILVVSLTTPGGISHDPAEVLLRQGGDLAPRYPSQLPPPLLAPPLHIHPPPVHPSHNVSGDPLKLRSIFYMWISTHPLGLLSKDNGKSPQRPATLKQGHPGWTRDCLRLRTKERNKRGNFLNKMVSHLLLWCLSGKEREMGIWKAIREASRSRRKEWRGGLYTKNCGGPPPRTLTCSARVCQRTAWEVCERYSVRLEHDHIGKSRVSNHHTWLQS